MEQKITLDKRNYRKHDQRNKDVIKKSLQELGAGRSVLIDADGSLIAGNGVYEQAKALRIPVRVIESDGKELVVVKRTDLRTDDEKRRKLALADNAASDLSEWDVSTLQADWTKEALAEFGVELPEFKEQDLSGMFEEQQEHEKTKDTITIQIQQALFPMKDEIKARIAEILKDYDGAKFL